MILKEARSPFERGPRAVFRVMKARFKHAECLVDTATSALELGHCQACVRVVRIGGQAPAQDVAHVGGPAKSVGRNRRAGLGEQAERSPEPARRARTEKAQASSLHRRCRQQDSLDCRSGRAEPRRRRIEPGRPSRESASASST